MAENFHPTQLKLSRLMPGRMGLVKRGAPRYPWLRKLIRDRAYRKGALIRHGKTPPRMSFVKVGQ